MPKLKTALLSLIIIALIVVNASGYVSSTCSLCKGSACVVNTSCQVGPQGPSGNMSVNATFTILPGLPANVINVGTPESASLNFYIPQGVNGTAGIDGINGTNGTNGLSANVTINATFTGPAGSNAIVTNILAPDPVNVSFDFTIPQGATGTAGGSSGQILYFNNTPSDIATYESLRTIPSTAGNIDESVSVSSATSPQIVDSYATASLNVTFIPAGLWEFHTYNYISSAVGTTNELINVYNRTAGGTETLLFTVTNGPISGSTTSAYVVDYVQEHDIPILTTDRLVVKIYGETTSVPALTFHFVYQGNYNTSHIHTPLTVPVNSGTISHNLLLNLTIDSHPQYANLSGRTGGQTLNGGMNAGESLTLNASANGGGNVIIRMGDNAGATNVSFRNAGGGQVVSIDSLGRAGITNVFGTSNVGGMVITGGTNANDDLILNGTSSVTKTSSYVIIQPSGGKTIVGGNSTAFAGALTVMSDNSQLSNLIMQDPQNTASNVGGQITGVGRYQSNGDYAIFGGLQFIKLNSISGNPSGYIRFLVNKGTSPTTFPEVLRLQSPDNLTWLTSGTTGQIDMTGQFRDRSCSGTPSFDSGGNLTCVSDEKAKLNLQNYTGSLDKLQFTAKSWKWKESTGFSTSDNNIGFSAQDVQKVFPEAIISRPDMIYQQILKTKGSTPENDVYETVGIPTGTYTLSINYNAIVALLVNSVKEEDAKITSMQATIDAQQKQIDELKARLDKAGIK